MTDTDKHKGGMGDAAVEEELKGVPEELIDEDMLDGDPAQVKGGEGDAIAQLKSDLEAAKQEVLYAKAEAQNVRRRAEKDVSDARAYAATGFARDILSVYDNLVRAIGAIPADLHDDPRLKALVTGVEATQREVEKVFAQHGISRIAAMGVPLDPNQHQAMIEIPAADAEPGTVVQEMQSGWMIRDRLLRPAMVGVAKKPD